MNEFEKKAREIAKDALEGMPGEDQLAVIIAAALDEAVEAETERCIRHITALRCDHDAGSDGDEALGSAIEAIRGDAQAAIRARGKK